MHHTRLSTDLDLDYAGFMPWLLPADVRVLSAADHPEEPTGMYLLLGRRTGVVLRAVSWLTHYMLRCRPRRVV